ncbi:MAG: hypothetical protein CMK54_05835, partial [Proteobacteria bacterium]|nr:hypothetical protein [Pseudomonadota bacterium]
NAQDRKDMSDGGIKKEIERRQALGEREAKAIGSLDQSQLRRLLEARGRLRSTGRDIPGRVPAAVAAALGKSRSFPAHRSVQGVGSESRRFGQGLAYASGRQIVRSDRAAHAG